jgi:hypothetical protein
MAFAAAALRTSFVGGVALVALSGNGIEASSPTIERVSIGTGGIQANNTSEAPAISADGRFVAFESGASNLVAGDTNGLGDVFVHDLATGVTERVSVGSKDKRRTTAPSARRSAATVDLWRSHRGQRTWYPGI